MLVCERARVAFAYVDVAQLGADIVTLHQACLNRLHPGALIHDIGRRNCGSVPAARIHVRRCHISIHLSWEFASTANRYLIEGEQGAILNHPTAKFFLAGLVSYP